MVAKTTMLACSALTAMVMLAGPAAHAAASNAELEQRVNQLEQEIQSSEMRQGEINAKLESAKPATTSGWWDNTSISGRMYYDLSWKETKNNLTGTKSNDSGYGFDVKRFYVSIDHKFNDTFSGDITTDINYNGDRIYTYVKKAYLQAKVNKALTLRLGATDLPWIPFAEGVYGKRYIENTLADREGIGTSSDWGVHALGKLANGHIGYDFAVVDGGGYKHPLHSKSMDFEGRVNVNVSDFVVAVGGYVGKRGLDTQNTKTYHTADRIDVIGAYVTKKARLGVEYFYANNFSSSSNITTTVADKAEGYSIFGQYQFTPIWGVFARYDHTNKFQDTDPNWKDQYFNVGLQWSPTKIVDFSLVYKHDQTDDGATKTVDMETNEVGVFSRFRW